MLPKSEKSFGIEERKVRKFEKIELIYRILLLRLDTERALQFDCESSKNLKILKFCENKESFKIRSEKLTNL